MRTIRAWCERESCAEISIVRAILASTRAGDLVLNPFGGSSTTGIAALLTGRRFVGVEKEAEYLQMSVARHDAFLFRAADWRETIPDLIDAATK